MPADSGLPHVLIVGGGFAGLWATRALASAPVRITLLDRENHHVFQPLLYQVATAGLSAPDISAPLRHILRRQRNVTVLMALRLKALIARDLWDTAAYWQVINADNPVDRSFQKALETLTDGTFQRLGMTR